MLTKKIDGRRNNRPPANVVRTGRHPKNENRISKSLNLLPATVERIIVESKRLGVSQAAVVDGWAKNTV